jgi:parvulin-like peptidyl-prolyl isomerase
MSVKVNQNTIPDWAITRQAEALFENVSRGMPGKPREVIELAAFDLAKERMIDQALMAQESKRRNYLVDPAELAHGMKQWLKQNGGKKAFQKNKHPLIKDQEDLKKEITSQIQFNRLLEEESACSPVPEKDALEYYESRPDLFRTEETLTASHLLKKASTEEEFVEKEQAVLALRKKIEQGMDFVEAVREESDDAVNDGHLGTFGKGRMVPEFETVAFSLAEGELSQPVRTQFGWHLILLRERTQPKITPFEEIREKIVEYLTERRKDKVFEEFLDRLKSEATIEEVSGI